MGQRSELQWDQMHFSGGGTPVDGSLSETIYSSYAHILVTSEFWHDLCSE